MRRGTNSKLIIILAFYAFDSKFVKKLNSYSQSLPSR